jgi:hypothetical protein
MPEKKKTNHKENKKSRLHNCATSGRVHVVIYSYLHVCIWEEGREPHIWRQKKKGRAEQKKEKEKSRGVVNGHPRRGERIIKRAENRRTNQDLTHNKDET